LLAKPIILRATYGTAEEPSSCNFRVSNTHCHVIMLHIVIPDTEISAVQFSLCVVADRKGATIIAQMLILVCSFLTHQLEN